MSAYNVNSLLVLELGSTSGTIRIANEIPIQKVVLKQYGVHFSNNSNHTGLLLLDIQPFTSATINTNLPITGAVPLICDINNKDTIETTDFEIDLDRNLTREFFYRIVKPDGTFPTNFTSATLIFGYDNGVVYS